MNVKSSTNFFIGNEVEHSPAYGRRTLFVVGVQSEKQINTNYETYKCEHIYFGANRSFPPLAVNDGASWLQWEQMVLPFLKKGHLCTLDVPISCVEGLTESSLVEYFNFIPMISAPIPYIGLLGYNATLKLDDRSSNDTNPGVWCHSLHDLKDRQAFTDWSAYQDDKKI